MHEIREIDRFTAADPSGEIVTLIEFAEHADGKDGRKFVETADGQKCNRVDERWFLLLKNGEALRRTFLDVEGS